MSARFTSLKLWLTHKYTKYTNIYIYIYIHTHTQSPLIFQIAEIVATNIKEPNGLIVHISS